MDALDALRDHALAERRAAAQTPELSEAAGRFEALLLGTLLRSGTKPIGGKSLLDGGSAGRMYREMLFEELARKATSQGGFGLRQLIERSPGVATEPEDAR